jgi:hypothetical protein
VAPDGFRVTTSAAQTANYRGREMERKIDIAKSEKEKADFDALIFGRGFMLVVDGVAKHVPIQDVIIVRREEEKTND